MYGLPSTFHNDSHIHFLQCPFYPAQLRQVKQNARGWVATPVYMGFLVGRVSVLSTSRVRRR